uniref:Uncharacterized protein n=1 Tax=Aegilops tauschii subsp. strangulata TaxID=200361 RepID=A0A453PX89_AEGTS
MGLMAGMLPGVEFARRRRLRPAPEAPCAGARRPALMGVFGHDHAHLGSAGFAKRSGVCEEAWATQLDSIAREAKERLDHKLRSQRESVVKRYLRFFLPFLNSLHVVSRTQDSDRIRTSETPVC